METFCFCIVEGVDSFSRSTTIVDKLAMTQQPNSNNVALEG
jgi:hypothetical protein